KRVDFRELIRQFAHAFKTKIEMRQIGSRQESARLGGIGSCGRELCCSTWLSDFKSVNTSAARYQNIAINQNKLSGQCGRLKCCLNYELDTYVEALEAFPKKADKLKTDAGLAILIKTDIFKQLMYYTYKENRGALYALPVKKVHEVLALNKEGKTVADLKSLEVIVASQKEPSYEDVIGAIELPNEKRRKKRKSRKKKSGAAKEAATTTGTSKTEEKSSAKEKSSSGNRRRRRKPKKTSAENPAIADTKLAASTKGKEGSEETRPKRKSRNRNRNRRRKRGDTGNSDKGKES
ncbi:MAG: regulatory iron-sulfur-containing complex subunit RicT, partial [Bacteroidota bacterium]